MRTLSICAVAAALTVILLPGEAGADSCKSRGSDRPSVGLVLGGGGARGSAHIGVIRALQEMKVPVDCVVGTSMGSLVGALYASGMNVDEMEEPIASFDWDDLFNDETPREDTPYRRKREDEIFALFGPKIGIGKGASPIVTGLISGQNIGFLFETLVSERTHISHFDELVLPFRAVAADLVTGDPVILEEGDLALAMRASMSIPAVFDPVQWEGRLLVDGGIAQNLPVQTARGMGADIVIAVDVGAGGMAQENIRNLLSVVGQLMTLMIMRNVEDSRASLTDDDVLVKPALGTELTSASFDKFARGVEIGYDSTIVMGPEFASLTLSDVDYGAYRATLDIAEPKPPVINFVTIDNRSQFSDDLILGQLNIKIGQPLDEEQLKTDIRLIYGLGFLEMVRYEVIDEDGQRGLKLHVEQDARGTSYLEWGLDLFGNDLTNGFNLRLGYLKTNLDELGSEFRIVGQIGRESAAVVDLYKYIDSAARTFIIPRAFAETREFTQFVEAEPVGVRHLKQYGADFALGREFSRHAALGLGIRAYTGSVDTLIGDPDLDDQDFDAGEFFADWTYDRLNDRYFPDTGNFARVSYYNSVSWLGSEDDYKQLQMNGIVARTFGSHTLLGALSVQATIDGVAPAYALFSAGGFFSLSGLHSGQVAGPNFGVAMASYQYRISGSRLLPGRVGFSVEYGGVEDDWEDLFKDGLVHGSLFTGFRTPIGPAYLGYGFGEGGARRWFLKFGRVFGSSSVVR